MKNLLPKALFIALLAAVSATAQPSNAIQRLVLNPMAVTRIPVALDRLTTVRLPSPPSDLESARVSTEAHPDALFLLSVQPGSSSFSLRALVANTNTTLNLTWKGQTYVLELVESRQPWLSVLFEAPPEPGVNPMPRLMPPARLLGLLDTAKAHGLLQQQHPALVAGVEVVRPKALRDYGDFTIQTDEVFRFDAEDTLIFRIGVSNKLSTPIQFIPESLMVRADTRLYYQSITDATGNLPARTLVPIYFAITGTPDGSRNALSPKNDFMVLLNRLQPAPQTNTPASTRWQETEAPQIRPTAARPPSTSTSVLPVIAQPQAPPRARAAAVVERWPDYEAPADRIPARVQPRPFSQGFSSRSPMVSTWTRDDTPIYVPPRRSYPLPTRYVHSYRRSLRGAEGGFGFSFSISLGCNE